MGKNKLELTWYGKDEELHIEPRILIEDSEKSNLLNGPSENMLIHGDNLLALKALEQEYAGRIKCIYIDPPYNTNAATDGNYDDNFEHSVWLSLMKPRLELMRKLLADDGSIFIQINNDELAYLKILCDEIFGRDNSLDIITVKMKDSSGVSGGGEDKKLKKNTEYILFYAKDKDKFELPKIYIYEPLVDAIGGLEKLNSYEYSQVLLNSNEGGKQKIDNTVSNGGIPIAVYDGTDFEFVSIKKLAREDGITLEEAYVKYFDKIYSTQNAQTSIRDVAKKYTSYSHVRLEYVPRSGKNKDELTSIIFGGNTKRLYAPLSAIADLSNGKLIKKTVLGNLWTDIKNSNLSTEGNVKFPAGKKPELLIQRILELSTKEGDLVLDAFLGSGTTAAVAHKMSRRWIGVEMGNQAYSHCKVRIDEVISGKDQKGISSKLHWLGGGGYHFYELAPSLIEFDQFGEPVISNKYDANMLAAAVAKHEGYVFNPSQAVFWKQSQSTEKSFLFVTDKLVDEVLLQQIHSTLQDDEFLLISCSAYTDGIESMYENISIKKIPDSLLAKCEFGVSDYALNIVNPPVYEYEEDELEEVE